MRRIADSQRGTRIDKERIVSREIKRDPSRDSPTVSRQNKEIESGGRALASSSMHSMDLVISGAK